MCATQFFTIVCSEDGKALPRVSMKDESAFDVLPTSHPHPQPYKERDNAYQKNDEGDEHYCKLPVFLPMIHMLP